MTQRGGSANSANFILGYADEANACPAIPDPTVPIRWMQKIGPQTIRRVIANIETGRRDGSGQRDQPILGPVTVPIDIGSGTAPSFLAPWFAAATNGNLVSSDLVDGGLNIYDRVWQHDPDLPGKTFTWYAGIQDIDPIIWRADGMRMDQLVITAAVDSFLNSRVIGQASAFSDYSPPLVTSTPITGTHPGPWLRGTPSAEFAGQVVWTRVEEVGDDDPFSPLKFSVVIKPEGEFVIPADFDAAIVWHQEYYTDADGAQMATWRDLLDEEGRDVGTVDDPGTRLPVQICYPGTVGDTAAEIQAGDIWTFAGPGTSQPTLVPTYDNEPGFTPAHMRVDIFDPSTGATAQLERKDATVTFAWPQEVEHGDASNFVTRHDRTDEQILTLASNSGLTSRIYQDARAQRRPLDATLTIAGAQWPGVISTTENEPAPRRTVQIYMPASILTAADMSIADAAPIGEALTFQSKRGFYFRTIDEVAP